MYEKLRLVVCVVCPCISHIVQYIIARQFVAICNCQKSLWPECSLCVDVEALPLATILVYGELLEVRLLLRGCL
jgi:hypothetical protein